MGVADPLRTEHAEPLPLLETLPTAAIATEGSDDDVLATLDTALAFLRGSLIPHAGAEDAVLYPMVEQVMHAPGATATMSRDHVEVDRMTADLQRVRDSLQGAPDPDQRRELQRILYGLYGIIRLRKRHGVLATGLILGLFELCLACWPIVASARSGAPWFQCQLHG